WFDQEGHPMSAERWDDPHHRVMQLLLGSGNGDMAGLVVVNGGTSDIEVTLPHAAAGATHRTYELRLTTSPLHKLRQGTLVASGGKDLVEANSISIYRA
ncbi:MAG: glycogen debranching enzyme GlgX, partial [Pseudarthrobacter sp.]|nr:glycogen debranching enzyme GlgX [Pseudarthrobacter sp.]